MTMNISKKTVFSVLFIVSLVIIFFVGRSFNAQTGERSLVLTPHGVSEFRKGLDVSGGTRLVYKISYDKYEKAYTNTAELAAVKKTIETIIMKNIDNRISKLGVSDYKAYVQTLDNKNYIVVEIGGIADLDQAKQLIGKTLELEFKLKSEEPVTSTTLAARKKLATQVMGEINKNPNDIQKLLQGRMSENIYYNMFTGNRIHQLPDMYKNNPTLLDTAEVGKFYGLVDGVYTTIYQEQQNTFTSGTGSELKGFTMYRLLEKKEGKDLSGNVATLYTFEDIFVQDRETRVPATDGKNILNGAYFKFANAGVSDMGEPIVVINLDEKGKEVFCNVTQANIGKPMAIFVGGNLLTAPNIQSKICGGTAEINGSFTLESTKQLSDSLNEGTLPAPLVLMQEEKISPTLGESALTGALRAGLVWFIAIMVFMYFMYGFKKMILTGIVLITFLVVIAAFMKLTDYALSLSGIAAIILSIGMWVDANILMYERLNEELKDWKSIAGAIDSAKARSRSAIRDGQLSTGLIALVLFSMGTNMFKGFWSMMVVTTLLTLFLNVPLTKLLLHVFFDKKK